MAQFLNQIFDPNDFDREGAYDLIFILTAKWPNFERKPEWAISENNIEMAHYQKKN